MVALLTAFYSFRVVYYTFFSKFNGFKFYIQQTHELLPTMGFALVILFFGSIFSGFLLKDMFVGFGNTFWNNSIFKSNFSSVALDFEFIPIFIKNIPLFFSLSGIIGALL
jgi:NADH:ubiquinone oxidoreductase subunit 5 (subunit L)/multisubunit Na+/H+ antiporter MnhA subunit